MGHFRNILFIMCDQLRHDYLSCFGHPHLHTPHLDALAARGVCFDRAYVNSPVCGPSRMSYYTGRYVHAHGASWNFVPLKAGEMTLGEAIATAKEDEALQGIRVRDLLQCLRGVGPRRAALVMEEIGIASTRRIRGLGQHQVAALLERDRA